MPERIMDWFRDFHFHTGHYLMNNYDLSLSKIQNDNLASIPNDEDHRIDHLYYDAEIFLRGSCQLFALALNEQFGYPVFEVKDSRGDLIHVFCKSNHLGQDIFIDVRGITTDIGECLMPFRVDLVSDGKGTYSIVPFDLTEDKKLSNDGDETGYQFAKKIVELDSHYYTIN